MEIFRPHQPAHKSDEFWYYPEEAVLLYENQGNPRPTSLEAKHSDRGRQEHYLERRDAYVHSRPHGLDFRDNLLKPQQRRKNAANTELVIHLCIELGLAPTREPSQRKTPLLSVPKFLAMFLEANRAYMHKTESLTQAIVLMQTKALAATASTTRLTDNPQGL